MAQHDLPAHAPRGELDPGERIDRGGIGRERLDVAQGDIRPRRLEQRGDVPADRGQVGRAIGPATAKTTVVAARTASVRLDSAAAGNSSPGGR